jgi:tetratricopeptide (TPR) repeat protein
MRFWPFGKKSRRVANDSDVVTFLVRGDVKRHLESAKALFDDRQLDQAIEEYQMALKIDPDCALVHFNLGFAQQEKRDLVAAKRSYHRAVELDPKCPLFHEHLGKLYFETEDYAQAILFFEKATELGPIQSVSYGILGRAHLARKEFHKSISALQKMLDAEQNPSLRVYGKYYICIAHLDLENLVEAHRIAQSILDDPYTEPQVFRELGNRFLAASCVSMADDLYKRMLDLTGKVDDRSSEAMNEIRDMQQRIDSILPRVFCGDEEVVLQNIHLLNQLGSAKVSRALLSISDAKSPLIREAVIEYNRRYGFPVWREILPFLQDKQGYVREKAAQFLKEFGDPDVVSAMRDGLFDELVPVKIAAAHNLKQFGRFDAIPVLTEALASEWDPDVREAFLEATSAIKSRQRQDSAKQRRQRLRRVRRYDIGPLSRLASSRTRNVLLIGILLALIAIFFILQG